MRSHGGGGGGGGGGRCGVDGDEVVLYHKISILLEYIATFSNFNKTSHFHPYQRILKLHMCTYCNLKCTSVVMMFV